MPQTPTSNASKATIRQISATISRLLGHYWTGDEHPAVRQAQLEDWLDDLGEFPPAIVEDAARTWRRSANARHRPLPGDIRALCLLELQDHHHAIPPPTLSSKAARALADRWAQQHNFASIDAWMDANLAGTRLVVGGGQTKIFFEGRRKLNLQPQG